MSLLPNLDQMTDNEKLAVLESIQKSIAESKEIQKKKIGENVDLVVQALKKIESDIRDRFDAVGNSIEKRVLSIQDGRDGADGKDGRDGKDGKSGRDGLKGDRGVDGQAGRDGVDGVDGISVVNAQIDFDGSLVISLSDGRELNVGEVVSQDIAEKIKVISTMSTNGAVGIKDEGSSISTGVKTINFVGATVTATNSGDDVTVNVSAGTGTVTSVGLSGGTTGLTTTGSPITTTGTITLGGTLAVASGGTGTATPSLVAGTNITSITGTWPNQTINASGGAGTVTSVAALTLGTSGTDLSSTVANSTTTPVITLNVPTASATNRGALSSADWTTFNNKGSGTVTSVTGTSPVVSSGGATPAISLAASYGDTQNPYASKTANFVLAAPNGSAGVPTFRAVVAADIPTLNQNTTGSAATVTTTINSGVVATTQTAGDNSTKVATTAYVNAITGTNGITGFKNRIINGAMVIDQRNAGASVTPTNGSYGLDRWGFNATTASKFTAQQNAASVTPPTGFRSYLGVTSSSAYSVLSSDIFSIYQVIEGYNAADLAWGTSSAATITISFWVRSSLTGTFGGALRNGAGDRAYPFTYTISSASTWEQKSVTIAGDTSGTWLTTNGSGIQLSFGLGGGSTYSGTAGAWTSAGNYITATGATSVVGTNGATFYVTGVQLEKGSTATSFDYRPYGTELALCQRYFIAFTNTVFGGTNNRIATGSGASATVVRFGFPFPVAMRSAPSVTMSGTPRAEAGSAISITSASSTGMNTYGAGIDCSAASGLTAGTAYSMDTGSGGYSFSSEL